MKTSIRERLFSIQRRPTRTIVRFCFLKFSFKVKELQADYLRRLPENELGPLLEKWYWRTTGRRLDLKNPVTFNEKIQWLKLYGNRTLMTRLADKIAVRDYVKERIGERYLVPLVGTYEHSRNIDFASLPRRFVIKPNHGSHWLEIVEDKSQVDFAALSRKAEGWLKLDYTFAQGFEMQYRNIPPRLMIERHLGDFTHDLKDYKVWVFHGVPRYIQVYDDRFSASGCRSCFYSTDWQKMPFWKNHALLEGEIARPKALGEMLDCAARLTDDKMPFARVDFYKMDDGSPRFGEITFTPASGNAPWYGSATIDRELGALIHLA